jgi:hypothetical protein
MSTSTAHGSTQSGGAGPVDSPLVSALMFIALVVAAIGSLGAPLITPWLRGTGSPCPLRNGRSLQP